MQYERLAHDGIAPAATAPSGGFSLNGNHPNPDNPLPQQDIDSQAILDQIKSRYQLADSTPFDTPEDRAGVRLASAVGLKVIVDASAVHEKDNGYGRPRMLINVFDEAFRSIFETEPIRILSEASEAGEIEYTFKHSYQTDFDEAFRIIVKIDPNKAKLVPKNEWPVKKDADFKMVRKGPTEKSDLIPRQIAQHPQHASIYIGGAAENADALAAMDYVAVYLSPENSPFEKQLQEAGALYFPYRNGRDIDDTILEISTRAVNAMSVQMIPVSSQVA